MRFEWFFHDLHKISDLVIRYSASMSYKAGQQSSSKNNNSNNIMSIMLEVIITAQPWRVILLPCVNYVLIMMRNLCVLINICCQLTPTSCYVNGVDSPQQSEEPTSGWRGTSWRPPTPVLSLLRQPVVWQLVTNHPTGRRQGQDGLSTFPWSASLDGTAATGRQCKTLCKSMANTESHYNDEEGLLLLCYSKKMFCFLV